MLVPETTTAAGRRYSSKILKAGASLPDTRTLFTYWDPSLSVRDNLGHVRSGTVFGKASRSRVEDILAIFRQRYLRDQASASALSILVKGGRAPESVGRLAQLRSQRSQAGTGGGAPKKLEGDLHRQ